MASPAPTSILRYGSERDQEDVDVAVPISRDKLRYFRAKKERWNAAQQLRHRPLQLLAVASEPPCGGGGTSSNSSRRTDVSSEADQRVNVSGSDGAAALANAYNGEGSTVALPAKDNTGEYCSSSLSASSSSSSPAPYRQQQQQQQHPQQHGYSANGVVASRVTAIVAAQGGDSDAGGPAPPPSRLSHRDHVVEFYAKHNPDKIGGVDHLLEKYQGREDQLLQKLKDKYEGLNTNNSGVSSLTPSTYPLPPPTGSNLRCFFRFSSHPSERVVVELFDNVVPVTCENFKVLCWRPPAPQGYKQSVVHRIVPNFCVQMGDYTTGNGTGGRSIYKNNSNDVAARHGIKVDMWGNFHDEAFLQHSEAGLLSMANSGPNKNSSQFFVTLKPLPHLDGKHVVFGRVLEGFQSVIVNLAQNTVTDDKQRPLVETIRIVDCGQLVDGAEIRHEDEEGETTKDSATAVSSAMDQGATAIPSATTNPIGGFSFGSASASSPFGAAFGFGSTTATATAPAGSILSSSSLTTPFSFAALSAAVANTSCDAFSSIRAVTTGDGVDVQAATSAAFGGTPRLRTLHESDSPSVATANAEGWHPVSSFAVRSHPPRGPTASAPDEEEAAAAAALRHTPSVPFSFSPSSTITTVDPFSFSFASSSSTAEDRMPTSRVVEASVATSSGLPTGHLDSDVDEDEEEEEEYDPDDDEEEYDSDETPTSCSEASVDDDEDDEVDDVAEADTFRMQATLESTFSSTVSPPPHAPPTFTNFGLAARGPAPTFTSVASPSPLATTGLLAGATTTAGDAPADQSSPLGAVNVNHSHNKTAVQISVAGTANADSNGPAKSTPSGQRQGFGFGFGSTLTSFSPGFGSVAGAPLSFAGLAASGTAAPVFAATTALSTDNDFTAKTRDFPPQPTMRDESSASLSFTAFRCTSNQTGAVGRGSRTVDDGSDDGDHEETSSRSTSSRSESPPGDSLRQVDHESSVTALMNTGCLSAAPTTRGVDGLPRGNQEAIDAAHQAPTYSDTEQIANIFAHSGVDSNDDPTSPLDLVSTTSGRVPESKQAIQATSAPPNAYSISFSSYGSLTFVDPSPSHDEVPSPCNSPTPVAHMQSLLDCSSETMDAPMSKLNETHESEIEDEPPEVADAEPSGPTCGLCWCLKSDTIDTTNPSIADGSDIEVAQPIQAAVEAKVVEPPKEDKVEALPGGPAKPNMGSIPAPAAIAPHTPVAASPLSSVLPYPTMSTDSEKEYVPESLRRFVAEASNALAEGHKSFLTCVKEDHPLPDEPIVPQDEFVERPPSAAARGGDENVNADVHVHSVESAVPGEELLVGAPSSLANSMLYLQPVLLPFQAPNAKTRPPVTTTPRFQVLGESSLPTKSLTSGVKPVDVPARVPFVPTSLMPSSHEASLDMTYAAILVRYRASPARREKVKALNQPMDKASTDKSSGTAAYHPILERVPQGASSAAPAASPQVPPYYFGNSGPASSAFYFGGSSAATNSPMAVAAPSSTGTWHTATAGSATSPLRSTASAISPGLVGATFSSSSTSTVMPTVGAVASSGSGGGQGIATETTSARPPASACSSNPFVFGSGILPVVFNFEDRDAREATYARYGTAVGASEDVAAAEAEAGAEAAPSSDGPWSASARGEKEGTRGSNEKQK